MPSGRHVKVAKFEILKPVGDMKWKEFADLLRKVRYRVFRLANLCVSEKYLQFHQWRIGPDRRIAKVDRLES